ncbi:BrnT family toxin [Burkholderia pseudomallei]|uniref:BrnT family toxin n=1 Tax=Burkholderia pseudomallei TaxID=28450 RepID=UPI00016A88E2|nr:BrnT family toxin [Burkholderia pseudomallei]KGX74993.1 hypothetical protein Y033_4761 [Burkholderia pseudomallei MSHR435]AGR70150.1 hypothetical protein BDL_3625 [Burkholderia pseudomallei MSHR305]AHK68532.1 hypothetical protein BBX_5462 [Burkholderia pseudomallei MSHR520]AIP15616.1 hypothetical protein DP60_5573 [Burkholderia pseudomallei]AIP84119.1 hypothetical protein JE55_4781 [Burkholderia pseudomallei]
MDITFDPTKNKTNIAKHGVSLALAAQLDWSDVLSYVDDRRDYSEVREVGFGVIGDRLYCVVFTQRGDSMHIISMRKANKREVKSYVEQA